jgi:hypothetical protein
MTEALESLDLPRRGPLSPRFVRLDPAVSEVFEAITGINVDEMYRTRRR